MTEQPHEPRTEPNRSAVRDDALVAALRDEITFLRQQLDHQTQITGMMARRLAELPAPIDITDVLPDAQSATLSDDRATIGSAAMPSREEVFLRRLWRKVRGG